MPNRFDELLTSISQEEEDLSLSSREKNESFQESSSPAAAASGLQTESAKGRDLTVSTLVHLMGLPSHHQIAVLEAKLDAITSKITALSSRVDRFSKHVSSLTNEQYLDRIDFQLADIRTLIKKVFPRIAAMDSEDGISEDDSSSQRGQISLTSSPEKVGKLEDD